MELMLRPMAATDAEACAAIVCSSVIGARYGFEPDPMAAKLSEALASGGELFVAEVAGKVTGFAWIDPRGAFASAERFPGVQLSAEWPDEALARLGLDAATALVALSHDPKLDDPALELALPAPLFYIGALGSRRTHEKRLERLRAAGLDALVGRIHSPIGLDLGGRSPAEIAVSILAEIIQVRYRRERA